MVWLRKLVFYIFLGIYLVCCPLLVLYALGYFFKPGTEQGIVKTGLIYAASVPAGAEVTLDKLKYTKTTPALIRDLVPGRYDLTVRVPGYTPWQQQVPVEAGKATVLDKILLLPEDLSAKQFFPDAVTKILPVPGTSWIILYRGSSAGKLAVFHERQDEAWPLIPAGHEAASLDIVNLYHWAESPNVVLQALSGGKNRYWWIDLRDKGHTPPVDITSLFVEEGKRLYYTPQDPNAVFLLKDRTLSRLDVRAKTISPAVLTGVRGLGFGLRSIYFLHESQRVFRSGLDGKDRDALLKETELFNALFGTEKFFDVYPLAKNILLFKNEDGKLITNRLPYELAGPGIVDIQYNPEKKMLAVWMETRIGIIDFNRKDTEQAVFEKGPRVSWVYRNGKGIKQVFWVYEGSHLVFLDGKTVSLLELETHGKPVLRKLFETAENSKVAYSEASGRLYFIDPKNRHFAAFELLPKKAMLFLPFPEFTEERREIEVQEL